MSDIKIVSKDEFHNGYTDRVPYGAILDDDAQKVSEAQTIEGVMVGAVPAVDWRGIDQVDTVIGPAKRGPGRPKGSKNKK